MNFTKINKINENHVIVSFDKSTEMFSMQNYVNTLKLRGLAITKRYQNGSEVFIEMKK
jgi:NAD-dependent DNA ligase